MPSKLINIAQEEWDDAKAFFTANPQEIKFRKSKKSPKSHSFFNIDNTLYAVNNTKHPLPESDAGAGGYSRVKFAEDKSGNRFVIKVESDALIEKLAVADELLKNLGYMLSPRTERKVNPQLGETGILKLLLGEKIAVETKFYTVLKYLGNRDLFTELVELPEEKKVPLSENEILFVMLKAMMSVQRLHLKRYIHTDLKLENFVVDGVGANRVVSVIDFDFSVILPDIFSSLFKPFHTGTEKYLAPEIIRYKEYSFKSDIYALGYLLYELGVNKKFFYKLLSHQPEKRPTLINAMYKIVFHLKTELLLAENESLEDEIACAVQEFYLLSEKSGPKFLTTPAHNTYVPSMPPLSIHVPQGQQTKKTTPNPVPDSSDTLLNQQVKNMKIEPDEKCCTPCRIL